MKHGIMIALMFTVLNLTDWQICTAQKVDLSSVSEALFKGTNSTDSYVMGVFGVDGNLTTYHMERISNFDWQLRLIETEEFQNELEVSSRQSKKLKDVLSKWRRNHERLISEISKLYSTDQTDMDASKKKILDLRKDLQEEESKRIDEIDAILVRKQKKSMQQLKLRFLIRVRGIVRFVFQKEITEYLGLGIREQQEFRFSVLRQKGQLKTEIKKAAKTCVQEFLSKFSKSERKLIGERWPLLFSDFNNLAHLYLSTGMPEKFEKLDAIESPAQKLRSFPNFVTNVAGAFEPQFVTPNQVSRDNRHSKVSVLFDLIKNKDDAQQLELSSSQMQQLRLAAQQFRRKENEAFMMGLEYKPDGMVSLSEMKQNKTKIMIDSASQAFQAVDRILTKRQLKEFDRICESALTRKYGPFWDLQFGTLSKEISFSQKKTSKLVAKLRERIVKESIEIEDRWLKSVFKSLEPQQQKKMYNLIGSKFKSTPAVLSRYLTEN